MKSHEVTLNNQGNRDAFLDQLENVQSQFRAKGIDYRIVGSLASHALLGNVENHEAVPNLDFDRQGAATPDQRVPDIDMLVPRYDLPVARQIRQKTIESSFPVKLGLAIPTSEIDFRPDDDVSHLTHKDISLPLSNELFQAEIASLEGVDLQTIPLDTLLHTYGTFGGMIQHKDLPVIRALIRANPHHHDPDMSVFHEFQQQRRKASPGQHRFNRTLEFVNQRISRRLRNELYKHALKAADVLGKR